MRKMAVGSGPDDRTSEVAASTGWGCSWTAVREAFPFVVAKSTACALAARLGLDLGTSAVARIARAVAE